MLKFRTSLVAVFLGLLAPAQGKPNVLFIAIDDLNDWIQCLDGHPQTLTPNLDRLAASGTLFTNAHCPGAACNASRTAVMTGISPHRSGLYANRQKMREVLPDAALMPQHFRHHGYTGLGSGKLLHYFIDARSWDDYFPKKATENPLPRTLYPKERPVSLPRAGAWQYVETDWAALDATDEEYGGDSLVADWVSKRLSEKHEQPFFLACGIYRPHEPWFVPEKYYKPFPLELIELPPGYLEDDLADLPPAGKRRGPNRYFAHIRKHEQWKPAIQGYLASIHYADAMLGRVLDALEAGPHADSTIVVLWSDHGWHLGEKQHWQKFTAWRDVSRVPLMIRVPEGAAPGMPAGTTAGSVCDAPVDLLSIFPTLTELTDLPPSEQCDGPSLVPLLKDPDTEWPHIALTHLAEPGSFGLSAKDWRYIRYHDGGEELYHIAEDPHEWHNLANRPDHSKKLEELRALAPTEFARRPKPGAETTHTIQSIHGWTVILNQELRRRLPEETARMLEIMDGQLQRVEDAVPEKALIELRKVPIWINPTYPDTRPGAEYHGNPKWLENNGRDVAMGKAIEISNTQIFPFENRRMPYLMLHELAHAYHDQVLGFDQPTIVAAFERARNSGSYDDVERTNGVTFSRDKAYAMTNHKEYFAELTEAYFGRNDFFPFNHEELKKHDPIGFAMIEEAWEAISR